MSLKDWPPFGANRETVAEWRERTRKELNEEFRATLLTVAAVVFIVFFLLTEWIP